MFSFCLHKMKKIHKTDYGNVHTAPFSFPFIFVDENAARSRCSVFKQIRYGRCFVNPLFKTMPSFNSCYKGGNGDCECHCNQQSINEGMCSVFKCLRFWCSPENGSFSNELFSNLCIFVSISEKAPFSQRSNVNAR